MLTWILQDGAWRGWPLWVALGALNTSLFMNFLLMGAAGRGGHVSAAPLLLAAWVSLALYLLFGRVRTRCGPLHLALPLDARRLWLAHTMAVALAGALLMGVMIGVGLALARVLGTLEAQGLDPVGLLAHGMAGTVLAAVLTQIPDLRLAKVPFSLRYALWFAVALAGVALLLAVLGDRGAAWVAVPAVLAVATAAVTLRFVPTAFTLVPRAAGVARGPAGVAPPARAAGGDAGGIESSWRVRRQVAGAVLRGVSSGAKEWFGLPFVVLFGIASGGGLTLVDRDLSVLRYLYALMSTYMLFSVTGPRLCRMHHLDALPISRRILFAALIVPYLAAFAGGYGIGAWLESRHLRDAELVDYRQGPRRYELVVPSNVYEVAWGDEGRAVAAPPDDMRGARPLPLWRAAGAFLYSPYDVPEGSPIGEVARQISRAAQAVYGVAIPPGEIADRYLETRADGVVVARGGGLTLRRDRPGLEPRGSGPAFPALFALVCVPWLLLAALLFRTYREGLPDRLRHLVVFGPTVALFLFAVGQAVMVFTGVSGPWAIQAAIELPLRSLADSASATFAVWVLAAGLLFGAWRVARRSFERMEIPTRSHRFTLVDWLRDDS